MSSERDKAIKEAMQFFAQHEHDEFYRAVAYSGYKHATDKMHEVLADFALAYHAKQNADAEKWIPVSERLPKDSGWFLVTCADELNGDGDTVEAMFFHSSLDDWEVNKDVRRVLAWMPLPAPYLEQAEGGEE